MTQKNQDMLVWHSSQVNAEDREQLLGHTPLTLWMTGLSASGKSTLAYALERWLIDNEHLCYVLDGDNVRHGLNSNLGFSSEDRAENIRRVAEVAKLMNEAGIIVIAAFISPYKKDRERALKVIGSEHFREVYVSTSLATCEKRDPKGMYRMARTGQLLNFTGVDSPYEPPLHPDLQIDTDLYSFEQSMELLQGFMRHTMRFQKQHVKKAKSDL
ncbi:adenylyl-sulfate kinase [Pseudomonas sp. TKO26]|uniref:adenylyl-sulfate kinase n=1 Tax=unclassified Pseudomonas TaxID=196821 RepID=UPI000D8DA221|nr:MULTISPECIES: adenylyl-sulfate kinase [unclassified Pseudomonas]PYY81601.1 adenylyl-sulfate kinase [Pseudomonas sp. TKO30]PYY82892.1 adenylyl-sulfate kinase [Pseudomonas sp. TKO29]PYY84702.1 adenylyl-sulfate kinase [Pseudomonas sp. TKO26]PYY97706.1 adenylyl-sulfate kinase [Pseudomonas sp. TKO14]